MTHIRRGCSESSVCHHRGKMGHLVTAFALAHAAKSGMKDSTQNQCTDISHFMSWLIYEDAALVDTEKHRNEMSVLFVKGN